jgi:hypothetical protein
MKLQEAAARLQESLDAFDADVSDHLENDTERADLWHDMDANAEDIRTVLAALSAAAKVRANSEGDGEFKLGDRVTKTKGASWTGRVVGFYSTALTPVGYAVESENEPGSVQIYPEAALAACPIPATGGEKA